MKVAESPETRPLHAGISCVAMIAGNPNVNRPFLAIAIILLLLALLGSIFLAKRKRTDPQPEPPLHPAALLAQLTPVLSTRIEASFLQSHR